MKVAGSALVHILCGVALASEQTGNQQQHAPTQVLLATNTGRLVPRTQYVYKRKNREDPANPVAAAATDPNEAAIMIKSRDLIPTDRPNFHPDVHRHRHGDQDDDDDDSSGGNDDDNGHSGHKKGSAGKSKAKGSSSKAGRNDDNDDDNKDDGDGDGDGDGSDSHAQKGKNGKKDKGDKDSMARGKGKDKDKAGSKQKPKGKGDDDKKNKKKKNTHTGLDGNEVDNEDDEDGQSRDPKHKKVKVKHIEAKQRHWRTGKPSYNYKKSLAGWKEVGPLYYFKGKYENAASPTISSHSARYVLLPAALAMGFAFAPFF